MRKQHKKSELEATQQVVKFFETVLRASADGIVVTDAAQNIVMVNDAFCALFGRRWREVVETSLFTWLEQLDERSVERWIALENKVHFEGACRNVEFQLIIDKEVRHFSVNASILERVADEERGVIISIWRDVTDIRRAEEALMRANEELEKRIKERTAELVSSNEILRQEIKERKRVEKVLRKREKELEARTRDLEELNSTLKVLLNKRIEDKVEFEESVLSYVKILIEPYIFKLKNGNLSKSQRAYLNTLEANLKEIISPFALRLSSKYINFSPTEIQVANLVKQGKTNKEISEIICVAESTIAFHQKNIRKKLGLTGNKTNLKTDLKLKFNELIPNNEQ